MREGENGAYPFPVFPLTGGEWRGGGQREGERGREGPEGGKKERERLENIELCTPAIFRHEI